MKKTINTSKPVGNHFVPQCYLTNFANDSGQILVHDKLNNKFFPLNIANVAKKRDLYYTNNESNNYYWELFYANNVEPLFSKILKDIIRNMNLKPVVKPLTGMIKKDFAKMIVYQMLRVPPRIDYNIDNYHNNIYPTFYNLIGQYENVFGKDNIHKIRNKISDDLMVKDILLSAMNNDKRINRFSNILLNKTWIFFYNESDMPFLISDNPIVMYNFIEKGTSSAYCGIGRKDTYMTFPISKNILLMLAPKEVYFGKLDIYNDKIIYTNEIKFINFWNTQQYNNCSRQLYFPISH